MREQKTAQSYSARGDTQSQKAALIFIEQDECYRQLRTKQESQLLQQLPEQKQQTPAKQILWWLKTQVNLPVFTAQGLPKLYEPQGFPSGFLFDFGLFVWLFYYTKPSTKTTHPKSKTTFIWLVQNKPQSLVNSFNDLQGEEGSFISQTS